LNDVNHDGVVDELDLTVVIEALFGRFSVATNPDANRDQAISVADAASVVANLD